MDIGLAGKTVTGASGGIERGLVGVFTGEGANEKYGYEFFGAPEKVS